MAFGWSPRDFANARTEHFAVYDAAQRTRTAWWSFDTRYVDERRLQRELDSNAAPRKERCLVQRGMLACSSVNQLSTRYMRSPEAVEASESSTNTIRSPFGEMS
jgi:hypothetical protein